MHKLANTVLCLAFGVTGCATIAGIDQFKEDQCPGGCDGGENLDATVDAPNGKDGSLDAPKSDAPQNNDSGKDSGGNDSGDDSGGNDGGCGPTNTIQNCGACGVTCGTTNVQNAACSGTTCIYTCNSGSSDCNSGQSPDTDGCECNTPSCCGSSCQTTHSNGIGQSYYDCVAQGTYNSTQANEACTAYASGCQTFSCTGPGSNMVVCVTANGNCVCWNFSGSNVGHVHQSGSTTCNCPTGSDPSWN